MKEIIYNFSQYINDTNPLNVTIGGISYCDNSYGIGRTNSDILSFEYIIEGDGTLEINGNTLYPQKGDIYLLTKNSNHFYSTNNTKNPWVKIWVVFNGPFAESLFNSYIPHDVYLVKNCNILSYMNEIIQILKGSLPYSDKVDTVSVILLKIAQTIKNHLLGNDTSQAHQIKQWINANVNSTITLDDICAHFSYSKNQIINIFKSEYNITPYQYYKQKRADSAKQYLFDTNLSIKEISQIMNFPDRHYFANFIKDNLGVYPTNLRNGKV